jgi:hypothetical protein
VLTVPPANKEDQGSYAVCCASAAKTDKAFKHSTQMKGEEGGEQHPNEARWHLAWPRCSMLDARSSKLCKKRISISLESGDMGAGASLVVVVGARPASSSSGVHIQKRARSGLGEEKGCRPSPLTPHPQSWKSGILGLWRLDQRSPRGLK